MSWEKMKWEEVVKWLMSEESFGLCKKEGIEIGNIKKRGMEVCGVDSDLDLTLWGLESSLL